MLIHVLGNVDELCVVAVLRTESRFRTNSLSNHLRILHFPGLFLLPAMNLFSILRLLQLSQALEVERESASAIPVFRIQTLHLLGLNNKPAFNSLYQDLTAAPLAFPLPLPTTSHLKKILMRVMVADPVVQGSQCPSIVLENSLLHTSSCKFNLDALLSPPWALAPALTCKVVPPL